MKLVTAVVKPFTLDEVRHAVEAAGVLVSLFIGPENEGLALA